MFITYPMNTRIFYRTSLKNGNYLSKVPAGKWWSYKLGLRFLTLLSGFFSSRANTVFASTGRAVHPRAPALQQQRWGK